MEVHALSPGSMEERFQHNRDKAITRQPLPADSQFQSGEQIDQQPSYPTFQYAIQYLKTAERLYIQQNVDLLELVLDVETCNKYQILDPLGQKVFFAGEESGCCVRFICGPMRNFEMHILDNMNNEVIRMNRYLRCVCCPFSQQRLEVFCPTDTLVGFVQQRFNFCHPIFEICDKDGVKALEVVGPNYCHCKCCVDIKYNIMSNTGEVIGSITKEWRGFLQEGFTDADYFRLDFPRDLDAYMKMVLLGATFLIDYMFYEKKK